MATPADLAGKTLWLDAEDLAGADGAVVTSWTDRSGLGHDPVGVTGTLLEGATPNGSKALRTSNKLALPNLHPTVGMQATVSSVFNVSYKAADLVDGFSSATYDSQFGWASSKVPSTSAPEWARLQPPTPTVVTRYRIYGQGNAATSRYPKDFTFEGSNTGTSWTPLDSRTGVTWATQGQSQLFTFANSTAFTYYRLSVTATQGAQIVHLGEIELNETPNGNPRSPGEMWLVVRANGLSSGSATSWQLGASSGSNYYPFTDGKIYDSFISNTRRVFTPTMPIIGEWRLLRVRLDAAGVNTWWLDETQQFTVAGATAAWKQDPTLINGTAILDIAGALILTTPTTSAQIPDIITWFNTKYGLSVPGGSAPAGVSGVAAVALPSLAAAATGNAPVASSLTATLPSLAASISGAVVGPTSGTLNATLPSLRASVKDTVSALTLTALAGSETDIVASSARIVETSITALAGSESEIGGVIAATPVGPIVSETRSTTRILMPRPWGIDPRTGRPSVRVAIVTRDGQHVAGLGGFQLAPLKDGVGVGDEWGITVARDDANARKILPVAHEAQLWRGNVLMTRGPIGPGRAEGGRISYSCYDPSWNLRGGRRVIGRVPKRQLLRNPGFTQGADGLAYWTGGWDTGSALAAPPTVRVVDDPQALSGKALEIGAVDKVVTVKEDVETSAVFVPNKATYLSGGEQKIKDVGAKIPNGSVVRITGFTANDGTGDGLNLSLRRAQAAKATLAGMGKKFVFELPDPLRSPNQNDGTVAGRGYYEQIPGGLKPNRRVNIAYEGTQTATGHQQYERQFLTVTQPVSEKVPLTLTLAGEMKIIRWDGAPKDGWALRMILHPYNNLAEDKIVDEGTAGMDEATPRVRWADYSTSVEVPADGKPYTLEVRFYPPAGLSRWVNLRLNPSDQLGFFDVDQALIVKGLVEHVQDPGMGKGDLGIKTRTPLTGIPRTKEYPFHERMPVETALEWFESIDRGLDIDCEVTETTAIIVTHYPRQGSSSDLALVHGGSRSNIKGYKPLSTSPADLASSIIMQADGSGASRPEAYARDAKALGGTLLEAVISAEEETPLSELDEGAVAALRQSLHPRAGWEVTLDPAVTTEALDAIGKGDTVRLVLPDEGIDAPHRMVLRQWDPATDVLTLTLVPEED